MPKNPLSSGIINGTNIGYIYLIAHPMGFEEFGDYALWNPYETTISNIFNKTILELMDTDGLIIDMRYAVGGRHEIYFKGLSKLLYLEEDYMPYTHLKRDPKSTDYNALVEAEGWNWGIPAETEHVYDKPIMVLTEPDCISACDFLVGAMAKRDEMTVIGKPTNGAFTAVQFTTIEAGKEKVVSGLTYQTASYRDEQKKLVGENVINIPVWTTKEDIINGVDTVRQFAIDYINESSLD